MFDNFDVNSAGVFYSFDQEYVRSSEEKMGILFPKELRNFYMQVGYGFFNSKISNVNRLMDPTSVVDFRQRAGEFVGIDDLEMYEPTENDKLIFFEVNEYTFVSIAFTGNDMGKVFFMSTKIADSLEEFLERFVADEQFFIK